ncbi:type II 3-dehydroquinate dehydratase [Hydrogenophaga sp.]|uniref:type II 3-dehydroquinate dehydratase n=1 Tax=Hydrogenophaga sp. TaxID=1904254 RepID=UPI00261E179F|nr:type II 3-dehydroquinate dehydratase [Hydrogenophaga sp.]MCW5655386.1 3-dehydroquinate dehydratase [Hydrogenophaga sp.]
MNRHVYVLNGPNLNLLGEREPHIYGTETLDAICSRVQARADQLGLTIDFRQSNHEGVLIDAVHEARKKAAGIIINPAGLSFYAVSLLNALEAFDGVKIEVHLTNRAKREAHYHHSLVSLTANGIVEGLGGDGYVLAVEAMAMKLAAKA